MAAVLRAFRRQLEADGVELNSFAGGPTNDEPELVDGQWDWHDPGTNEDDGEIYFDDARGGQLDPAQVREGQRLEMEWITKQKVFVEVPLEQGLAEQGRLHDMKWINTKKGEIVRSRLVVREIKARKKATDKLDPATVFAAMPPVEGVKALISHMQTEQVNSRGEELEMMVLDVSRAHFYGESRRRVFTTLPPGHEDPGFCALLLKTMYGTEDAASIWQDTWSEHVKTHGVRLGLASSALFVKDDLRGLCHGDDFMLVAARPELEAFRAHLALKFEVRVTGHIGYGAGCDRELEVLKRTIRLDPVSRVMELEADTRHVDTLLDMFGLEGCKPAATPRQKIGDKMLAQIAGTPALDRAGQTSTAAGP